MRISQKENNYNYNLSIWSIARIHQIRRLVGTIVSCHSMKMGKLVSGPGRSKGYREIKQVTQTPTPSYQYLSLSSYLWLYGRCLLASSWRRQKPKSASQVGPLALLMQARTAWLPHFRPLSSDHNR